MLILGLQGGLDPVYSNRAVLGHTCHDASAVVIQDGAVRTAIEEERLSRIKHSNKAAVLAINVCMSNNGVTMRDVHRITIPCTEASADASLRRLLLPASNEDVRGARELVHDMFGTHVGYSVDDSKLTFVPHHVAHAASAYYCAGLRSSLVVALDGYGDTLSGLVYSVDDGTWTKLRELSIPQSLGEFYLHVTKYLGYGLFDEYKVMGLAPYGDSNRYREMFRQSYALLPEGEYSISEDLVDVLCEAGPRRRRGEPLTQFHKDIAAALQEALEDMAFHMLRHFQKETGHRQLCLAGGVAHNCTLNGKILYSGLFDEVFVQPAAHDAGLALGGALWVYYSEQERQGHRYLPPPRLEHVYLGTDIGSNEQILEGLAVWGDFIEIERESNITEQAAELLADGKIIGWVQGRSEFGPRALGNRSILADPRPAENKDIINRMVKKREAFRPFAPAVLEEYAEEYFEIPREGMRFPFMTFVLKVREDKQTLLGATTHVDGTARIQTVSKETNPRFWALIDAFRSRTGVPVLLNTSFNNNAEPIVDSVNDAVVCFLTTDLHHLVVGDYLMRRKRIERAQFLQLVPSLPAYCVLRCSKLLGRDGEAYRKLEICRNYDERLDTSISAEAYKILEEAGGEETLDTLFKKCKLSEEKWGPLIEEVKALWSQRSIVLRPRSEGRPWRDARVR
ncbi:MAG: carbamoyltransferase family protein [Gammaproteobacteria bacterium]